MDTLLRKLAEWKGRRKAAQIIIFDGAAEVQTTRAFLRGALAGVFLSLVVFLLTAPTQLEPRTAEEISRREQLLLETSHRLNQALAVADACVNTAEHLQNTLSSYQSFLRDDGGD